MFPVASYTVVTLVALIWSTLDANANAAFEFLRYYCHVTAREMRLYREWLLYSLPRCVLLFTLVGVNVTITFWTFYQNPFDLGQTPQLVLFGVMLLGSLAIFWLLHLFARFRFRRYLVYKAGELSELLTLVATEKEVPNHFEPADYCTENGWTAWHPKDADWKGKAYWDGIVAVV